jgi:hypothetical protein
MRVHQVAAIALAAATASFAGGSTLRMQGGKCRVSLAGDALPRLTEAHGDLRLGPSTITLDWSGAVATLIDSGASTDAGLLLRLSIGPSFRSGSNVTALFDGAIGDLSLLSGGAAWQVTQFNFRTYSARATYDSNTGHVGVFLPVLLRPTTAVTPGPIHAVMILDCRLDSTSMTCSELGFGLEPFVAGSFPGELGIAEETRRLLGAPRVSPSAKGGPNDKCCAGAWACQCAGDYVCPVGGCSYVCQDCYPDPYCFECNNMGCSSGCYQYPLRLGCRQAVQTHRGAWQGVAG